MGSKKMFYLMGKSGSGKDTIYKKLLEENDFLDAYIMYTTRPIRSNEVNGVNYNYISNEKLEFFKSSGLIMESRSYKVANGDIWTYATIYDNQFLGENDLVGIGTLESYNFFQEKYGEFLELIPIYINVDDEIRKQRLFLRESKLEKPDYEEINRRIEADKIDFSFENLRLSGVNLFFENDNLDKCISSINEYIKVIKNGKGRVNKNEK